MTHFPRSLIEFQRRFPDERACAEYLARVRWPDGFRCPSCGQGKGWELSSKAFTWECASCRRQTLVTAGTVMHASKLPLTVWFWAAYLMATHSNGIAALQLQAQLGLGSYKSAWLLAAKLRRAMVAPGRAPLAGLVELDETAMPLRHKDDPHAGGQGRSPQGKMLVAGAVEVHDGGPGRVRLGAIQDASAESLHARAGDANLLLRPPFPLAARHHRKHQRPPPPRHAPKNQPSRLHRPRHRRPHLGHQLDTQKIPRLQNTR